MAKARPKQAYSIAVDFDGTIVEHQFPKIGPICGDVFQWLKRYQDFGVKLILWTVRSDGAKGPFLQEAIDFCLANGVEFDSVNTARGQHHWSTSPKAYANLYIDDANLYCPLCPANDYEGARPYADWRVIGPAVERLVMQHYGVVPSVLNQQPAQLLPPQPLPVPNPPAGF